MSDCDWGYEDIKLSSKLYNELKVLAEKQLDNGDKGVVEGLVKEILTNYVEEKKEENKKKEKYEEIRFYVYTYFEMQRVPYCIIEASRDEDKDNDFLGKIDLRSKESLLRVARDGWGILPEEIKFLEG